MLDTVRYVLGVLIVISLPPALLWWFLIHPFAGFWRRVGAKATMAVMILMLIVSIGGLFLVRDALMGPDLGYVPALVPLAAVLFTAAAVIAVKRKRHLTARILMGVPEVSSDGPGELLTGGIYGRVRNPRYVEVILGVVAYAAFSNYVGPWLVALATFPLIHAIVLLEERELAERFGEAYARYCERVPRYLPRLKPSGD